jgi:hypothetical protein
MLYLHDILVTFPIEDIGTWEMGLLQHPIGS